MKLGNLSRRAFTGIAAEGTCRDKTFSQPIIWTTTLFMILFHVGAMVALFLFTWKALILATALWWISGGLRIGMAYHRLLTHRGYKTPKWVEYSLTLCGALALEGGPIAWVTTHRVHHQNTDRDGDPHSPRDGGLWAHMGWIMTGEAMHNSSGELLPFVPDLRKDKFHVWISRWHWVPIAVLAAVLFVTGGWSFVFWGIFLRTVVNLHGSWLVNSATHMWGSQRFSTGDTSTNSFWVAVLTFGEGWHNNHHAVPQSARHGLRLVRTGRLQANQMGCLEIRIFRRRHHQIGRFRGRRASGIQSGIYSNPFGKNTSTRLVKLVCGSNIVRIRRLHSRGFP
jgi:stearoyl-CoA desaturase (delta-9 desaturase)